MTTAAPSRTETRWRSALRWFPTQWAAIDRDSEPRQPFGAFEAGLLVVAAVALIIQRFPARGGQLARLLPEPWTPLGDELQWALVTTAAYVLVPIAYLRATGRRVADFHLGWQGTRTHLRSYLLMAAMMAVPLTIVSATGDYQRIYPFYEAADRSVLDLVVWELAYGLQFVGLEFFFRGYLLHGLRPAMGHAAIFVMVVPYCMLHFGKTWSESTAAIVAGIVLGTFAMRWRSIWGGVLVHWAVAIGMDLASLARQGGFPPHQLTPWS